MALDRIPQKNVELGCRAGSVMTRPGFHHHGERYLLGASDQHDGDFCPGNVVRVGCASLVFKGHPADVQNSKTASCELEEEVVK